MSSIQLPGLLSGIDTTELITQLMAIERRTLNMYENRKSTWDERKDALSTLENKLSNLRTAVKTLSGAQELRAYSTSSSDTDKLTAEASHSAFEGNHTVVINQLATAERWVHTSGIEYIEDYVGVGTFIYSYNHQETVITTTATTTLEDLVGLINNDANNPGVTASLLYYNGAYHLVLNGDEAGSDYSISINASSTEVWEADSAFTISSDNATLSTKITDLDQFSGTLEGGEVIEITGTDHFDNSITQVNLSITRNTKLSHIVDEINDAFDGIAKATLVNGEIVLTDSTSGDSDLSISLTYNANGSAATLSLPNMAVVTEGGSTTATLAGFADADFIETQSAQDSQIRVDGYPTPQAAISEVQTLSGYASRGDYTLTYDGETTAVLDDDATIEEIQAALEALPNVEVGDITVSGYAVGQTGDTIFTFRDTLGDVSMISIDSSDLDPPTGYTISETTKGSQAGGGWISRSSNTIDDVISGVTLHLHDTTDANGEEITLTRDIQSVKEKLTSMVEAYNMVVAYIQEQTDYDETEKKAGVLMSDYVVSTIRSQIRTPIIAQISGFIEDIDTFLMAGQIGLELDKDGLLNLNSSVFDEAIAEDYMGVLAIIGADKTGSSDSNIIEFYGASSKYTMAGSYNVEVIVSGGVITSARIKLSTESTYRNASFIDNIITGNSTFDDNGDPVYPENALQLSVDLSQNGTFTATVRVKQGFAGAIEDALDKMLKVTTGSIQIDQEHVEDQLEALQDKIELEEERLEKREQRLIVRYARLERTLALIQSQLAALGFNTLS